ncbi:hypothetical protein E2C01_030782 [Portunus trituberculatus]|uniref:Uncharacterized protein n=1 Tax=Portunus trituberculatus TaxID=210409 RepID=A0A5B7EW84_PORTR|nr:hypothetical protein [Portunus trituberculatus]
MIRKEGSLLNAAYRRATHQFHKVQQTELLCTSVPSRSQVSLGSVKGERIHSRLTMMKEFCQFDLYCQRGVIPDLLLVNNPPNRAASLRDKSERNLDKKETNGRRTSTGSLPY